MYGDFRLTRFWYVEKAAIRYESRENVAYGSPKLISSIAEMLTRHHYPVRKSLIVEITSIEKFFKRRRCEWFVTQLCSTDLISENLKVKLNEDSILVPSKFFVEQNIDKPVTEIMVRIPPKCDWKLIEKFLLTNNAGG